MVAHWEQVVSEMLEDKFSQFDR